MIKEGGKQVTCLGTHTLRGLTFFRILQGSNRYVKIYYFVEIDIHVEHMKIHYSLTVHGIIITGVEPEYVNYESIILLLQATICSKKKSRKINFKYQFY